MSAVGSLPAGVALVLALMAVMRVTRGANAHPAAMAEAVAVRLAVGDLDGAEAVVRLAPAAPTARVVDAVVRACRAGTSVDEAAAGALVLEQARLDTLGPLRAFSVTLAGLAAIEGWVRHGSVALTAVATGTFLLWGVAGVLHRRAHDGAVAATPTIVRAAVGLPG